MPITMLGKRFQSGSGGSGTFTDGFESGDLSKWSTFGSKSGYSVPSNSRFNGSFLCDVSNNAFTHDWLYAGDDIADQRNSLLYDGSGSYSVTLAARYIDDNNHYLVRYGGNNDFNLVKVYQGNIALLDSVGPGTSRDNGHLLEIECIGNSIIGRIYNESGTSLLDTISATDSDIASGYVAFGGDDPYESDSYNVLIDDVTQVAI